MADGRYAVIEEASPVGDHFWITIRDSSATREVLKLSRSQGEIVFDEKSRGALAKNAVSICGKGEGYVGAIWEGRREVESFLVDETPPVTLLLVMHAASGTARLVERSEVFRFGDRSEFVFDG